MSEPQRMKSSAAAQSTDGAEIDDEQLRFLASWLATTPPDRWEADSYRFLDPIEKLLLSDQPASQYFRFLIWNELELRRGWSNVYKNGMLALVKDLELRALIAEKRRLGVKTRVAEQAKAELAKRWGHLSGSALDRWLRRNRAWTEQT
jgi:hypothetical protein